MAVNQNNFSIESANNFIEKFENKKNKRIVLYGIGLYTATLIKQAEGFNFVGLMDGNPDNISKIFYDLTVLSVEEAKEKADFIVINTSEFYWQMIYERIANIGIPIYFPNGEMATKNVNEQVLNDEEKSINSESLKKLINVSDVVTFDLYDTLIMRKICNKNDVFKLVDIKANKEFKLGLSYIEMRSTAISHIDTSEYSIDDIYDKMQELYPNINTNRLKNIEIDVEKSLTVPRRELVDIYMYAKNLGKKVYIISDMYLTKEYIIPIIKKCGIDIDSDKIWISCEKGFNKRSGLLWQKFSQIIESGKKVLHIGDDIKGDIEQPQKYGIKTVKIASASKMLEEIASSSIIGDMTSIYSSICFGIIANELFNSPFAWNECKGKYLLGSDFKVGKTVLGMTVMTYLLWIIKKCDELNIRKLYFLSRDGYFLEQDYLYLMNGLNICNNVKVEYLFSSRKAVLTANFKNKEAIDSLKNLGFKGTLKEYLDYRFDINIANTDENANRECILPQESSVVEEYVKPYVEEINEKLRTHFVEYKKYLTEKEINDDSAIVDLFYKGTIQYWLSKLLNCKIKGFYLVADLSEENELSDGNMYPCFQDDEIAKKSYIWKYHKFIESYFTAPYGSMRRMNKDSEIVLYDGGKNQENFSTREIINIGIKSYIDEYLKLINLLEINISEIKLDWKNCDKLYGIWFKNNVSFSDSIKNCFWNEDRLVNGSSESSLF